jgi:hypothetical protein
MIKVAKFVFAALIGSAAARDEGDDGIHEFGPRT